MIADSRFTGQSGFKIDGLRQPVSYDGGFERNDGRLLVERALHVLRDSKFSR